MKYLIPFLLALLILTNSCKKKSDEGTGFIKGKVENEFGGDIDGATVEINSKIYVANGNYISERLSTGEKTVTVSKQNYLTQVKSITVKKDEVVELNFALKAGVPFLDLSDSIINFNSSDNFIILEIMTNSGWVISSNSSWLEFSRKSGEGNTSVNIKCKPNTTLESRTEVVEVRSGNLIRNVVITQTSPIVLMNNVGFIGNDALGIDGSVKWVFNKPVSVEEIKFLFTNCQPPLSYQMINNDSGLILNYSCAKLGEDYSFSVRISDTEGNVFNQDVKTKFYNSKIDFNGSLSGLKYLNNQTELLVYTSNPTSLFKYSLISNSVIKTYSLPNNMTEPRMTYNPFNSLYYFFGNSSDIYTYNLDTEQGELAVTIQPDSIDHPTSPTIIPYSLRFTANGLGMVLLKAQGSTSKKWRMINSANNDTVYQYPYYNSSIAWDDEVTMLNSNFDNTKLFVVINIIGKYGVFDQLTQQVSLINHNNTGYSNTGFIITNDNQNEAIFVQSGKIFLINLNGQISSSISHGLSSIRGLNYTYQAGKPKMISLYEQGTFKIMDFSNLNKQFLCKMNPYLSLSSNSDGSEFRGFESKPGQGMFSYITVSPETILYNY